MNMDKIFIKDLRLDGILGIYERERITPQEIVINVIMFTDTRKAAETDEIADCVDYEKVANRIRNHAKTSRRMTAEALSNDLACLCLETPGVRRVIVRVEKTQAIGDAGSVGVEVEREKA